MAILFFYHDLPIIFQDLEKSCFWLFSEIMTSFNNFVNNIFDIFNIRAISDISVMYIEMFSKIFSSGFILQRK